MENESMNDWWDTHSLLPFSAPTTILICGSTQSGKTHFTNKLLQNANGMFSMPVDRIIYAYSELQLMFEEMEKTIPNLSLHQGLPTKEDIEQYTEGVNHTIVVLDDLMLQVAQSQDCVHLFTVTSHHRNVTTVMLSQNLYPPGKYARTISLNCLNVIYLRITVILDRSLPLDLRSYQDKFLFLKQPMNPRLDQISVTYMFAWNLHKTESTS